MSETQPEVPKLFETLNQNEQFQKALQEALDYMSREWGVADLTNREVLYLSRYVRECVQERDNYYKEYLAHEVRGAGRIDPGREAAVRWLIDLFGVNDKEVPMGIKVSDKTSREEFVYSSKDYKMALQKYLEFLRRDVASDPLLEIDIKYAKDLFEGRGGFADPMRLGNTASPEFRKLLQIWRGKFNRGDD